MKKERLSMQLDVTTSKSLNELCTYFNCNKSEATRKAFSFLHLYKTIVEQGGKFMVEDEDGDQQHLKFL
jgi:hypothetical protein